MILAARPTARSAALRPAGALPLALLLFLTVSLLLPTLASADAVVELEPTSPFELEAVELTLRDGAVELSLDQAVEIALNRNLGLVVERYNWVQSGQGVLEGVGIYDTLLNAFIFHNDSTQASASVIEGVPVTQSEEQQFNINISQLIPTGATVSTNFFNRRTETNNQNVPLNPLFIASNSITFDQPLLRGFGRLSTERLILRAKNNLASTRELFEQRVAETIQQVEDSYWLLVESLEQEKVAQEALDLARELHEQNRVRVDVGTKAPLELVQSEAGIAQREEGIIRAEADVEAAYDSLRVLLNLESGDLWNTPIRPVTPPETDRIEIDLDQAIRTALAQRPEVRSKRYANDNLAIDSRFFARELLPQLDLRLNYGRSALAGDQPIFDFTTGQIIGQSSTGLGDAWSDIIDGDFDNWEIRLDFSYPIQNRARRAQKVRADFALEQAVAELEELKQTVINDVRRAARQVQTAAKQIDSAMSSRQLEEKNLEAERKRYENGLSTSYRVLDVQEDLTSAASREVNAITGYRRALVEFYRVTGRLLEIEDIEIADY